MFDPNYYEMGDPVADITAGARLMQKLAVALSQGSQAGGAAPSGQSQDTGAGGLGLPAGGFAPAAAVQRVKCTYCNSLFVMGTASSCPNCGAAYTG